MDTVAECCMSLALLHFVNCMCFLLQILLYGLFVTIAKHESRCFQDTGMHAHMHVFIAILMSPCLVSEPVT